MSEGPVLVNKLVERAMNSDRVAQHAHTAPWTELPSERRFLKGAALSVWQNSPDESSQWTAFARHPHNFLERFRGKSKQLSIDTSPDFWNRYTDDIACARHLGSNSIRLSLEWSRIMPDGTGRLDEDAVQRYRNILDQCVQSGLEPMVTLHHFVHPAWFQNLGGFEREENIRHFVDWAVTAFQLFSRHGVSLFATFNEPTCAAFTGYIVGVHAPGHRGAVRTAGRVLLHMLRAHTAAYRAIRAQPGGEGARVGLVHQQIRFEAESSGAFHGFARWTADWLTHCFGWDVVHEYMLTGRFSWRLLGRPGTTSQMEVIESSGRPPCDWLGINYYTRVVLDWRLRFTCRPGEVITDMGWPVVPEGLYDAIVHCADLGVPLYITETGIADGRDDRRAALIASYWGQVARAVGDGYDVRGFYYWTLVDNFEWHLGYNMKFGLFEWTDAPQHPQANPAAVAAAAAAYCTEGSDAATETEPLLPSLPSTNTRSCEPLIPLQVFPGPSRQATVTATIVSVSQPSSPVWSPSRDINTRLLPALIISEEAAPLPQVETPAARSSPPAFFMVEQAVAEAEALGNRWSGRRLRKGALELVRRYMATPDELAAAQRALTETVWPHIPLPEALRRRTEPAPRGVARAVAEATSRVLTLAGAVVARASWGVLVVGRRRRADVSEAL